MSLTTTEEAQTRALIAQNAALLSLAASEPTIISKLAATKVSLADLTAATSLNDTDLFLVRQGTTEKSVAKSVLVTTVSASDTVAGIVELATVAEVQAGTDTTRAVTPAGLFASSNTIQGSFKNLSASATGLSANVIVLVDEIVVESNANTYKTLRSVSLTIAGTTTGTNALDTGTIAVSTWYSLWVIWNGTATAGLMSLSVTAPTMPSGYTHKARIGWIRTDETGNKYPLSFAQFGRHVTYKPSTGSNLTGLRTMASGVAGNISTPTFVAVALGTFVPPTASIISVLGAHSSVATAGTMIVAPNNSYGNTLSITNPCPIDTNSTNGNTARGMADMLIETNNIYWANALSTGAIFCRGWQDNI